MSEKSLEEAKEPRTFSARSESGSMEETKGRASGWSDERRSGWGDERESRSWGEKREDKDESDQQWRGRDGEIRRRSYETESRFRQQKRGRDGEWRRSPEWRGGSKSRRVSDEGAHEYPYRAGARDCEYYLRTGECGYGRSCRFNHPPPRPPTTCQYYMRGACRFGSSCRNHHPQDMDGAEPALPMRHEQRGMERQRREDQEDVQEQRQRERKEAQENVQENQNVEAAEEERKREIQRQRREARLKLEQMKPTVRFNDGDVTLPEWDQ